jgi:hypothetical protein
MGPLPVDVRSFGPNRSLAVSQPFSVRFRTRRCHGEPSVAALPLHLPRRPPRALSEAAPPPLRRPRYCPGYTIPVTPWLPPSAGACASALRVPSDAWRLSLAGNRRPAYQATRTLCNLVDILFNRRWASHRRIVHFVFPVRGLFW